MVNIADPNTMLSSAIFVDLGLHTECSNITVYILNKVLLANNNICFLLHFLNLFT